MRGMNAPDALTFNSPIINVPIINAPTSMYDLKNVPGEPRTLRFKRRER